MHGCLTDAQRIRELLLGSYRKHAVRAAAILGSIKLVPDLLELLDEEDLIDDKGIGPREALIAITGLAFDSTRKASEARELWLQHAARFDKDLRYRDGEPLTIRSLLQSLVTGPGSREARQNIYLEILASTDARVPRFSPFDFVGTQIKALRRIKYWLEDPECSTPSRMRLH
jgi:hypothetical protein